MGGEGRSEKDGEKVTQSIVEKAGRVLIETLRGEKQKD